MRLLGNLTTVFDYNRLGRPSGLGTNGLNLVNDVKSINDTSKHHVLSIEPRGIHSADKELASV